MTRHSIDRRIERTRDLLHHAMISLILKKGYDAITITDICQTANISRSTFYMHYTGKDDLKKKGVEDHLRRMLSNDHLTKNKRPEIHRPFNFAFSLPMFEHARAHLDLYRALLGGTGSSIALASIRKIVSERIRAEMAHHRRATPDVPRDVKVQYVVGAYMSLLTWWLDSGARLSPEKIDATFQHLADKGVWSSH